MLHVSPCSWAGPETPPPPTHTHSPTFWLAVCLIKVQNPELCACLNNANAKMLLAILVAGSFTVLESPKPRTPKPLSPDPESWNPTKNPALLFRKTSVYVLLCMCVGRNVSLQFRWRADTITHTHTHLFEGLGEKQLRTEKFNLLKSV